MRNKSHVVAIFFVLCSFSLFAQGYFRKYVPEEPTPNKYDQEILNFNIQGIKIGCQLNEFLKTQKFTSEFEPSRSDSRIGLKVYRSIDVPNIDGCQFEFFNDKLYCVKLFYSQETCDKMGGWPYVLGKLKEKYGRNFNQLQKVNNDSLFEGNMHFDNVNRYLFASADIDMLFILVMDKVENAKLVEKKAQGNDLGF